MRAERIYWASLVIDGPGTPHTATHWQLYVNARRPDGLPGLVAVEPAEPLINGAGLLAARPLALARLSRLGWTPQTAWEQRARGWVCWLESPVLRI